jgi:hypothetical protein
MKIRLNPMNSFRFLTVRRRFEGTQRTLAAACSLVSRTATEVPRETVVA